MGILSVYKKDEPVKRGSILGEKLCNIISFMGIGVVQGSGWWKEPAPPYEEILLHDCDQGGLPDSPYSLCDDADKPVITCDTVGEKQCTLTNTVELMNCDEVKDTDCSVEQSNMGEQEMLSIWEHMEGPIEAVYDVTEESVDDEASSSYMEDMSVNYGVEEEETSVSIIKEVEQLMENICSTEFKELPYFEPEFYGMTVHLGPFINSEEEYYMVEDMDMETVEKPFNAEMYGMDVEGDFLTMGLEDGDLLVEDVEWGKLVDQHVDISRTSQATINYFTEAQTTKDTRINSISREVAAKFNMKQFVEVGDAELGLRGEEEAPVFGSVIQSWFVDERQRCCHIGRYQGYSENTRPRDSSLQVKKEAIIMAGTGWLRMITSLPLVW